MWCDPDTRKLMYSALFSELIASAPTWHALLLQSTKQSPLVSQRAHIHPLSPHLGRSLGSFPDRCLRQSSPFFILNSSTMQVLKTLLSAPSSSQPPFHFLPLFSPTCCPAPVAAAVRIIPIVLIFVLTLFTTTVITAFCTHSPEEGVNV